MARKLVMEFIGTFFLVLIIGLSTTSGKDTGNFAPIAIGCGLMALVYMGGHVSGAHYNPAVSIAVLMRKKMSVQEFVGYVIIQIIAATVAAYVVHVTRGQPFPVHI